VLLPLCPDSDAVKNITADMEAAARLKMPKSICASPQVHAATPLAQSIEQKKWKTDRSSRPISRREESGTRI
jgi:hypothetical protein